MQPVQPPNDIQETDADTEADPSGPGPAEAAPEAVSIDCLLSLPAKVGVGKGVKRSNKMIEKDSKRDFIYVGDSTDEEDSKPKVGVLGTINIAMIYLQMAIHNRVFARE